MSVTTNAFVSDGTAADVPVITNVPTLTATIPCSGSDIRAICLTPDGTHGFAGDILSGDITVFDPSTNAVLATATAPFGVRNLVATNTTLFLSAPFSADLVAMDIATLAFTSITGATSFGEILVISPDFDTVYLPSSTVPHGMYSVDATTLAVTTITTAAGQPNAIAISPDSATIYTFSDQSDNTIYYGAKGSTTLTGTIVMSFADSGGGFLAISQNGLWMWASDGTDTYVISTTSHSIAHTDAGISVIAVAKPNPTANTYLQGDSFSGYYVYDDTGTLIASVATSSQPEELTISPDESTLFMIFSANNDVDAWSIPSNTLNGSITLGSLPQNIVCVPATVTPGQPLVVPDLFIPRKGFPQDYRPSDLMTDMLAIESWANQWAPPLFIPRKPPATPADIDTDWLAIERWAETTAAQMGAAATPPVVVTPIFIPRKSSMMSFDLTTDFLAIQNWAHDLWSATH